MKPPSTVKNRSFTLWMSSFLVLGLTSCGPSSRPSVQVTTAYGALEEMFQTEVINLGLEKLGYTVVPSVEEDYDIIHRAINGGYLDYTAVHWHSLHNGYFDANASERVGSLIANAAQGYLIDKKTAEEYSITSLEDLKDPEIARLFDSDGDGKANLVGCNVGWGCEKVIEHHLDAYGLRNTVEHDNGQYFSLIDETINRFNKGESVLYYTWTPLWVSEKLKPEQDVVWLEVPYTSLPSGQGSVSEADTSVGGKNLGFKVDTIGILANKEFLEDNPDAYCFFQLASIDPEDVNRQNQLMKENFSSSQNMPSEIRKHAERWIEENQVTFNEWIESARKAARDPERCPQS
jgi:glycine betaine/proline transport system substrate-binding protein